jgi:hypothetical protein
MEEAGFLTTAQWLWRLWIAMQLIEEGGEAIDAWPQSPSGQPEINPLAKQHLQPQAQGPAPIGSDEWLEELNWLEIEGLGPFRDRRQRGFPCR